MFEEQSTINIQPPKHKNSEIPAELKKIIKILIISFIGLAVIGAAAYWFFLSRQKVKTVNEPIVSSVPEEVISGQLSSSTSIIEAKPGDFLIEEISFQNFYPKTLSGFKVNIDNYTLPINVKTDVVNYYEVSRKINLDPGIISLNQNGFATLKNPDEKKAKDFYSSYAWLEEKGLPILVTSDFLIYYYQNSVKLSYKHLEENLFYDTLWNISKELFEVSRGRYESRREKIGDINDQVLEGERLELAFFAVSLQLLKPQNNQIVLDKAGSPEKFSLAEAKDYSFTLPSYLKDDVERELTLIREAKEKTKSPVLLYARNYEDFKLPYEYKDNPRLNNFYLAAKWLNSNFPLYYQGKDCPDCQLDENDWQVNLTAAAFIANDFYQSYQIKNQWARVYKTLAFFKGLREDLTYLNYQKTLEASFGSGYDLETILSSENQESNANYGKLRSGILALRFPEWAGGLDRDNHEIRPQIGFRILADFFSANDFIASQLTTPKVGDYQEKNSPITACASNDSQRCKLLALDVINLLFSYPDPLWLANTKYLSYSENFLNLKETINNFSSWQTNNYWSNLKIFKNYLDNPRGRLPVFAKSDAWRKREIDSVKAFWLNLQSVPDLVKVSETNNALGEKQNLEASEYYYIEPNLDLIDELIANSEMILGMYKALQIDREAPPAYVRIEALNEDLKYSQALIKKELSSQTLSIEDTVFLGKMVRKYQSSNQVLNRFSLGAKSFNYQFSAPKMLALVFKIGNKKALSVGPIFSYSEK